MTCLEDVDTATVLADGMVLVAGGCRFPEFQMFDAAELFDPATGGWTLTGSMAKARSDHTLTRLGNGEVLVAGGSRHCGTGSSALSSAEIYDPRTGAWTTTAPMAVARWGHTATPLRDGRVLVVGGRGLDEEATASAELYDPSIGTWTPATAMTVAREGHSATLLLDGRVLVAGCYSCGESSATAELYDPATGTWTPTGSLREGRNGHAATLLADGRVLVAGGTPRGVEAWYSSEIYDPASGTWSSTGNPPEQPLDCASRSAVWPCTGQVAVSLPDGTVLAVGGVAGGMPVFENYHGVRSAEIYDPVTGLWAQTAGMTRSRVAFAAVLLLDGTVLVIGGDLSKPATAELYRPASGD